jgi:hypothetical protein
MVFVALAAFFAFRAYREAATANTIARESAIRQDRAYLDFETVGYDSIQQIPGTDASIIMRIEFKNFGHTPADDLALEIEYGLFRCSDKVRLKGEKETLTGLGAVMPQDTWGRSTKFAVSNGEFLALQTNTYEIRATIGATYLDAFEEPREVTSTFVGSGAKSIMGFIPGTRSHT